MLVRGVAYIAHCGSTNDSTYLLGPCVSMSFSHGLGGLGLVLVAVHPVARVEHAPAAYAWNMDVACV